MAAQPLRRPDLKKGGPYHVSRYVDLKPTNQHTFNGDRRLALGGDGEVAMGKDHDWNDTTRDELRATLRSVVLGEVRLARRDDEDILNSCNEIYLADECPEGERSRFMDFATQELGRARKQLESEQVTWPDETDSDRLDLVEEDLRERGILMWQASPCCDTCTGGELPNRIDEIDRRSPGFRDRLRGYTFFIDQNLPDMLSECTQLSVYLAYGWYSPDGSEVAPEEYQKKALGIAREVCECLRARGFEMDWNGDFSRKIGVSFNWQRRNLLR